MGVQLRRRLAPAVGPRRSTIEQSDDPCQPQIKIPRRVVEAGSHLRTPNYWRRYQPAARDARPVDSSMSHVEFRCVVRYAKASKRRLLESQEKTMLVEA